jgi:hypothetical protein
VAFYLVEQLTKEFVHVKVLIRTVSIFPVLRPQLKPSQAKAKLSLTKIKLQVERLCSLTWILNQEAIDTAPFAEEVLEVVLNSLGWRAESRAQRHICVRGVLADQVGYIKTAITLVLIDCMAN